MVIIGLVGKLCSGKTEVIQFSKQEYAFADLILEEPYSMDAIILHLFFDKAITSFVRDKPFYKEILKKYWDTDLMIN